MVMEMMSECPNCGHVDPPYWRHKRFRLFTCYCHISDLELWAPKFAKLLIEQKDITKEGYIYHLTKSGYVDRIHKLDSANGSWHEPSQEKPKYTRYQPMGQTKLSQ